MAISMDYFTSKTFQFETSIFLSEKESNYISEDLCQYIRAALTKCLRLGAYNTIQGAESPRPRYWHG